MSKQVVTVGGTILDGDVIYVSVFRRFGLQLGHLYYYCLLQNQNLLDSTLNGHINVLTNGAVYTLRRCCSCFCLLGLRNFEAQ